MQGSRGGLFFFKTVPGFRGLGGGGDYLRWGLHKELEYKEQKLNKKKLEVIQPKIENKSEVSSWWRNHPGSVQKKFYSRD